MPNPLSLQPMPPLPPGKKLPDQAGDRWRTRHYSCRTEQTYVDWIKQYTLRVFRKK